MGVVGGSRHYSGGGLGAAGLWECPACGEENAGPLEQGCAHCGSGRPGRRAEPATPPPPPPPPAPPLQRQQHEPTIAEIYAKQNPQATIEDAFMAGYQAGVAQARAAMKPKSAPRTASEPTMATSIEARQVRTLIAALELFRDQFLQGNPEEVQSGEWCSADEVSAVIDSMKQSEVLRG